MRCEAFKGRRFGAVDVEGLMAIKSIVEMKAKPGRRDELLTKLQQMSAGDAPGFIAAEHYRNVEDEDTVIGIYDWKSNEERVAWSQSLDPGEAPVTLPTVGMVPSCLFNVISQNDAHGRCEHFQQLFPRAGVDRLCPGQALLI